MHIINVKLFNFKSYKHHIIRENFSPGLNIFLGANGSGKTTLFDAIDTVFYLKHRSSSKMDFSDLSKYSLKKYEFLSMIEISLDNTDRFFPIQNNKLTLKRVFGFNVDKFLIHKQSVLPNQFFHFLNFKKIYLDRLFLKIKQEMNLEFKNVNYKKRLKIFQSGIGLNSLDTYEKKSIKFLTKLNVYKKELLFLVIKLKKKEIFFSKKLKLYKKNKKLSNNFLIIQKILSYILNKISKKKIIKYSVHSYTEINLSSVLINRLVYNSEEIYSIKFRTSIQIINKSKEKNIKKKNSKCEDEYYILILYTEFDSYISLFYIFSYLEQLFVYSCKHLKQAKKKYIQDKKRKKEKYFREEEDFFYSKIYESFYIFQMHFFIKNLKTFDIFQRTKKIEKEIYLLKLKEVISKKKIQFFRQEIAMEIQNIKVKLYMYEDQLKNMLGNKTIRGIRAILKTINVLDHLKNKVFGLLIDLILVHRYFYKAVESILKLYLRFIVIKDKNTALQIIRIFKNTIKNKIEFIISEYKRKSVVKLENLNSLAFPIIIAFYYNPIFQTLFKNLLKNTYFLQSFIKNNCVKFAKKSRIVSLDGDIYSDGSIIVNSGFQTISIFEIIILLKKNRIFFDWLINCEMEFKDINKFLNILNCRIKYLKHFIEKTSKLLEYIKKKKNLKLGKLKTIKLYILVGKKLETSYIFEKQIFKKIRISQKKRYFTFGLKPQIFVYRNFWFLYDKILNLFNIFIEYIKFNYYVLHTSLFDLHINYLYYDFNDVNLFKILKNTNIIDNNFISYQKIAIFFQNFLNNSVIDLLFLKNLIIFLAYEHSKKKKKQFLIPAIYYIQSKKKNISDLISSTIKKKIKSQFSNAFIKIVFLKKIFSKMIYKYDELNTNAIVINQTFDILLKKKQENLKISLIKTAKKFRNIIQKNFFDTKVSLVVKYKTKNWLNSIFKKKYKNITGITILAKFKNQENICLLEQMSNGQASVICFVFILSFRVINPVSVYIFDELDTNLDFYNNLVISYIIKQISTFGTQFFLSTFCQNSIMNGDKWFGILNTQKGSLVQNIQRKTALKFIGFFKIDKNTKKAVSQF